MRNALVVKVLESLNELMEIVSGDLLRERSSLSDEVEQLPVLREFKGEAEDIGFGSVKPGHAVLFKVLFQLDNILVVKSLQGLYLIHDQFVEGWRHVLLPLHDFQGVGLFGLAVHAQLHFCEAAGSKSLLKIVFSKRRHKIIKQWKLGEGRGQSEAGINRKTSERVTVTGN